MSFPYTSVQIREFVESSKALRRPEMLVSGEPLPFSSYGSRGKRIDLPLDLSDGRPGFVDLRFHLHAAIYDDPETFEAALILAQTRVRGVGWHATGKKRYYGRVVIPPGWHQNIIDPNLEPGHADYNRHLPLPQFAPSDLSDFFVQTARLWHIELPTDEVLL